MFEDDQDHIEIIETWHTWYWYRYSLSHAMLSDAINMMDDYPEAKKISDLPIDAQERCAYLLETAILQKELIGPMGGGD